MIITMMHWVVRRKGGGATPLICKRRVMIAVNEKLLVNAFGHRLQRRIYFQRINFDNKFKFYSSLADKYSA